jgi:UDP-glucose 4-epimerase
MKVLITGVAGFIGSNLAKTHLSQGDAVYGVDNFSTGQPRNIENFEGLEFIEGSVSESIGLLPKKVDVIYHFASPASPEKYMAQALNTMEVNTTGTLKLLEYASYNGARLIFASTSEIYGKNDKVPLNEEDDRIIGHPLKSRWSYSEAKAVDESLAYFYYFENKLPIRIVRFFNTVGPRQVGHYGMVLPRFVSAALKNETLSVYGTGDQIRCFCHVDDAVRALLLVMDSDNTIGEVFNVGNNQQISIMELANKVIEITKSSSSIEKIAYEKAYPEGFEDMQRRVPDISKINRVLGWEPEINLDQIIKDIATYNSK